VSTDIPLSKLNNPQVINFYLKYIQTDQLGKLTSGKTIFRKCYEEQLKKSSNVGGGGGRKYLYESTDQTTAQNGRKVAISITGLLKNDQTPSEKLFIL
jgi:hypothetical protein